MECLKRSNAVTVVDRLEKSFYVKIYAHGQHHQFLMIKNKYDTSKDIDKYMSLAHDLIFTLMSSKNGIKGLEN